jgi:hypothetical protein
MPDDQNLLRIAGAMAARLKIWQRLQQQAREAGRDVVELHPGELFETQDQDALEAWETYLKARAGEVPLPM